jgi:threonine dehydrogenase-like Zn-dependent dehydrogenase
LVKELTHGLGADIVYECVGRPFAVQSAVDLARRGGSMCLIGLADQDAPISPSSWLIKEIQVSSALAYNHEEFDMVMGMIDDGRFFDREFGRSRCCARRSREWSVDADQGVGRPTFVSRIRPFP